MIFTETPLFLEAFFLLMFGHFLADFPLQQEYLATAKDPTKNPIEIWTVALLAHCTIHAGIVFVLTGSMKLAMFMLGTHILIDVSKCVGFFGKTPRAFLVDQLFHTAVVAIIAAVYCAQG